VTDREILAIGGGLALGFMVVWFMVGDRKTPKAEVAPAAPGPLTPVATGDVIEGTVLSERPDTGLEPALFWRNTLGVGATATRAHVDAAYQELCRQYDVTKLEQMAPELRQLAQARRSQIDDAYRQGIAEFTAGVA